MNSQQQPYDRNFKISKLYNLEIKGTGKNINAKVNK